MKPQVSGECAVKRKKDFRYVKDIALEIYKRTGEENYLTFYKKLIEPDDDAKL